MTPGDGAVPVEADLLEAYARGSRLLVTARLDADGRILDANAHLRGTVARPLVGTPFEDVIAADQRPRLRAVLEAAGTGWTWIRVGIVATPTSVPEDIELAVVRSGTGYLVAGEPLPRGDEEMTAHLLELTDDLVEQHRSLATENRRLGVMSETDSLTGLANRRALDAELADRVLGAQAAGRPLSVVMIDLDHFKAVNDTHGHAAGDAVLAGTARTLLTVARGRDLVARYGGEEIAVVLVECAAEAAAAWAERARLEMRDRPTEPPDRPITASFGVATMREGDTAASLLARADAGLYAAKRAGRDRVEVA